MTIVRDSYEAFTALEVGLRQLWMTEIDAADPLTEFFNMATSADAAEYHDGDQGFGDVPEYKGKIDYEDSTPMWKQTYTHLQYAKGLSIERALIDDDRWNIVSRKTRSFGMAFQRTVAHAHASVFNNAFDATDHPGPDAVALCSATHDYSPEDGSHQVNYQALQLTEANVNTVIEAGLGMLDPKGSEFPVTYDTILVPVALRKEAITIASTPLIPGTLANDINVNAGLRVIVSPLLSDSSAWFMIDSSLASLDLNWYWRVAPEFAADPTSQFDLVWRYRGYMRYSFGWDDYRWIYGCNPS